jgi:AcrR family transcriptional regulator
VREIADAADVSTTTLMNHFPTKAALVFDRDDEIERALVATVAKGSSRPSVLAALRGYMRARASRVVAERRTAFIKLVRATPALADYWQQMWMRHEDVLARALAKRLRKPAGDLWCGAVAHFALGAAALAEDSQHPAQMIEVAFDILERGA